MNVHFSSKTDQWATPQDFFDKLNEEFYFDVDVCADESNAKTTVFFSKEQDGLNQDWKDLVCWMNPPYGREIGKWVRKAATGGGKDSGVSITRADRYQILPRIYLQKYKRGNKIYQRTFEIWRLKKFSSISKHGRNI